MEGCPAEGGSDGGGSGGGVHRKWGAGFGVSGSVQVFGDENRNSRNKMKREMSQNKAKEKKEREKEETEQTPSLRLRPINFDFGQISTLANSTSASWPKSNWPKSSILLFSASIGLRLLDLDRQSSRSNSLLFSTCSGVPNPGCFFSFHYFSIVHSSQPSRMNRALLLGLVPLLLSFFPLQFSLVLFLHSQWTSSPSVVSVTFSFY